MAVSTMGLGLGLVAMGLGLGLECVGLGLVLGLEALSLESKSACTTVQHQTFTHV